MRVLGQTWGGISKMRLGAVSATMMLAITLAPGLAVAQSAKARSFIDFYKFTGGADGSFPLAHLTLRNRKLYGTTQQGGNGRWGTIFSLKHSERGWELTVLYSFTGYSDGSGTSAGLTFDKVGNIYGTSGGGAYAGGVAFELRRSHGVWKKQILHSFGQGTDGDGPLGDVIFDGAGKLYGTTYTGGDQSCDFYGEGCGTVFQLIHAKGKWKERVIYRFAGGNDGSYPSGGLVADKDGNLYGMTDNGGGTGCYSEYGCGIIFQLKHSSSGWKENVLHRFTGGSDGAYPQWSNLILDEEGNLYGTTTEGGTYGDGVAFRLSPSNRGWRETVLYAFGTDGTHPSGALVFDHAHNLYGMTEAGGPMNYGTLYQLRYSNRTWSQTVLHNFTGSDGAYPESGLTVGRKGQLYGAAEFGGGGDCTGGCGVVFRIKR